MPLSQWVCSLFNHLPHLAGGIPREGVNESEGEKIEFFIIWSCCLVRINYITERWGSLRFTHIHTQKRKTHTQKHIFLGWLVPLRSVNSSSLERRRLACDPEARGREFLDALRPSAANTYHSTLWANKSHPSTHPPTHITCYIIRNSSLYVSLSRSAP